MDTLVLTKEASEELGYIPRKEYWETCRDMFKGDILSDEVWHLAALIYARDHSP
jgi:hypothetical protein